MERYSFKCKCCGSKKYTRDDEKAYICAYCGYREIVILDDKNDTKQESQQNDEMIIVSQNQKQKKDSFYTEEQAAQTKAEQESQEEQKSQAEAKPAESKHSKGLLASLIEAIFNQYFFKILICFFFGILGVHKFVEGKIGWGLIYLFTGGCFVIGYLLDLAIYAINYFVELINKLKRLG